MCKDLSTDWCTAERCEALCQTYGIRSQVDDPEEIGVAAATRDKQVGHVFPGVQQRGIAVRF